MGEELDEHDPVRSINGELNGEDLLRTHYTLSNNANDNDEIILEPQGPQIKNPLILRPTTPHQSSETSESVTETIHGPIAIKFEVSDKTSYSLREEKHRTLPVPFLHVGFIRNPRTKKEK